VAGTVYHQQVKKKPLEMVTGPAAFDNFKRLMGGLLAVPKAKVLNVKAAKRKRPKRKAA
jgi:hypothetical protein